MTKQMTPEEYAKFRDRSNKLAQAMIKDLEGTPNDEILCGAMTIMTYVISLTAESKDNAYRALAALYEIGDKMIEEADAAGAVRWKGYLDTH